MTYKVIDELKAQLDQAQNMAEIRTAIWAIYDYLNLTTSTSEMPQSISREAISKKETTDEKIEKIKEMLWWYKWFIKDGREIYPEWVVADLENILSSK